MTARVKYWAVERADGSQEHVCSEPSADDATVVRFAKLPRRPHVDGHEIWDFDAAKLVPVRALVRNGASQRYCAGNPWRIHVQHVRKEMLARLIVGGNDLGGATIVHKEATMLRTPVLDLARVIIDKAEAGDDAELERIRIRAKGK